ncbi:MAG: nucleotidyl transferase AbiEii/AbiGii toxin family protein [Acetatifactor sp.]|nr:nucleotidyl transferase AbiEii/AbiGii toxin family protein [Acetatifactor sp.]
MYLHNDRDLFEDVINETNSKTGIAQSIIEKDYYVTMILKLLAKSNPDIVFKGGTSLSKCFHLINRFSEDIDITFSEHIGASRRKKLKYNILKPISEELGMPIKNWDSIESDKDYNYYLFGYQPVTDYPLEGITPDVKLETALVSYSFPTEIKPVSSIIHNAIKENAPDIIANYDLEPFSMRVQSVNRTFIDKIYALCDYYMEGKSKRYSRHLYDIYKLYPSILIDDAFKELTTHVREHRSHLSICPSAKEDVDVKELIYEFLDNNFYKSDYDIITKTLVSDEVPYEQTSLILREIADKLF